MPVFVGGCIGKEHLGAGKHYVGGYVVDMLVCVSDNALMWFSLALEYVEQGAAACIEIVAEVIGKVCLRVVRS